MLRLLVYRCVAVGAHARLQSSFSPSLHNEVATLLVCAVKPPHVLMIYPILLSLCSHTTVFHLRTSYADGKF